MKNVKRKIKIINKIECKTLCVWLMILFGLYYMLWKAHHHIGLAQLAIMKYLMCMLLAPCECAHNFTSFSSWCPLQTQMKENIVDNIWRVSFVVRTRPSIVILHKELLVAVGWKWICEWKIIIKMTRLADEYIQVARWPCRCKQTRVHYCIYNQLDRMQVEGKIKKRVECEWAYVSKDHVWLVNEREQPICCVMNEFWLTG